MSDANKPVIEISSSGGAAISSDQPVRSDGFLNCHCFVVKNFSADPEIPDSYLVMHINYAADAANRPLGIMGITNEINETLQTFLSIPGKKVGVLLFKPFQNQRDNLTRPGGQKDHGVSEYLQTKGVKLHRQPIPYFVCDSKYENAKRYESFTVLFDPESEQIAIETFSPNGELSSKLPDIKPFGDMGAFKDQINTKGSQGR